MSECACLYGGFDDCDSSNYFFAVSRPSCRKPFACRECKREVQRGEVYRREATGNDGSITAVKICATCGDIQKALYCDGFYYGQLWDDIETQIFAERGLTQACIDKVPTVEAKRRLQRTWAAFIAGGDWRRDLLQPLEA